MIVVLVSGCADFAGQAAPTDWSPAPSLSPEAAPNPVLPGQNGGVSPGGQGRPGQAAIPPPRGCQDFNPAVIGTCLDQTSAIAALPSSPTDPVGLVAERVTGRIMRVHKGDQPALFASVPVTVVGDGGLTGLALSPTYTQDQLIFAYVTTPTDNRVLRIAPGDTPKAVLTGIPRGTTDNRGALAVDHRGALLVATGDAGDPAAAADPHSLAGKVLRIDVNGAAAPGNPVPGSAMIASGLADPGGVCSSADGSRAWVTDRAAAEDVLYRLPSARAAGPGSGAMTLSTPAWTWPDRPGVAGCASFAASVMVATAVAGNIQSLAVNADGSFTGKPQVSLAGKAGFGRLSGLDIVNGASALGSTTNKAGGTPVSSDDRAVLIAGAAAGGGQD
jgi:hypothetical protein